MRIPKCFTLLAVAMLPLLAGFSQTVKLSTAPQANALATLPSSADEVVSLTKTPTTTEKGRRIVPSLDRDAQSRRYAARASTVLVSGGSNRGRPAANGHATRRGLGHCNSQPDAHLHCRHAIRITATAGGVRSRFPGTGLPMDSRLVVVERWRVDLDWRTLALSRASRSRLAGFSPRSRSRAVPRRSPALTTHSATALVCV